jgi:chemotaxis protein MotA
MAKATGGGVAGRIDWCTFGGLALAFAGILGGLVLEGGHIQDVAQVTAAAIVLGGTVGAVLISKPFDSVRSAWRRIPEVLFGPAGPGADELAGELVGLAKQVRRIGIASLENQAMEAKDPFVQKALGLAADGVDSRELKRIMEMELETEQLRYQTDAAVFEAGGGYSPTIGIIGAVLGLIQVMKHLDRLEEVGRGIAVAFVATVYGVALANVVLLPIAAKIQARAQRAQELHELILNGVLAIAAGTNPRLVRLQLDAYCSSGQVQREQEAEAAGHARVARIG